MANGFVTDYSFLNLPEKGSAVRGPIELPSFEPVTYLPELKRYNPFQDRGADSYTPRQSVEDMIGSEVNQMQKNYSQVTSQIRELIAQRDDAVARQDIIRQEAAEQQIQALENLKKELETQYEALVEQARQQGIDAVAAAEAKAAEELQQVTTSYEGQINEINQALANVTAERDQAIAEQDTIRAQAADEQAQALESQKQSLLAERESLLGAKDTTITDLQAQIAALQQTPVEGPSVISEQPATPFDQYLRDQEKRELTIDLGGGLGTVAVPLPFTEQLAGIAPQIPNQEAIQKGIEELYGRVTAGGAKPEDFVIYQLPAGMPTPETTPPPPAGNMLYAGGSLKSGLYGPGGKFDPRSIPTMQEMLSMDTPNIGKIVDPAMPKVLPSIPAPRPVSPIVSQPPKTLPVDGRSRLLGGRDGFLGIDIPPPTKSVSPSQIINSKIPLEFFNNTIYSPSTKPVNSFLPIQRASFAKGGVVEILRSKRNKKER
jgi:hypothetical protein